MAKSTIYPGADRSKWFDPLFEGAIFTGLEKILLHSTETDKRWGCPGYDGGKKAPTFTINPWPGYQKVWQHFPANESARALLNPSSTAVGENKDNVAQIEVIGYSDKGYGVPRGCYLMDLPQEGHDYIAKVVAWLADEWTVPLARPALWPIYPASYGNTSARMTSSEYDRFTGVLAHLHASGNTHGDIAIDIDRLLASAKRLITPQEDDVPLTDDDIRRNWTGVPALKDVRATNPDTAPRVTGSTLLEYAATKAKAHDATLDALKGDVSKIASAVEVLTKATAPGLTKDEMAAIWREECAKRLDEVEAQLTVTDEGGPA